MFLIKLLEEVIHPNMLLIFQRDDLLAQLGPIASQQSDTTIGQNSLKKASRTVDSTHMFNAIPTKKEVLDLKLFEYLLKLCIYEPAVPLLVDYDVSC